MESILKEVRKGLEFWLNTDHWKPIAVVASLEQMADALKKAPIDVAKHHIKQGKNDFELWVKTAVKDEILARKIKEISRRYKNPQDILEQLQLAFKNRVEELRSFVVAEEHSKGIINKLAGTDNPPKPEKKTKNQKDFI